MSTPDERLEDALLEVHLIYLDSSRNSEATKERLQKIIKQAEEYIQLIDELENIEAVLKKEI